MGNRRVPILRSLWLSGSLIAAWLCSHSFTDNGVGYTFSICARTEMGLYHLMIPATFRTNPNFGSTAAACIGHDDEKH